MICLKFKIICAGSLLGVKINRFKVYNMPLLITKLKYNMVKHKKSEYYDFIKNIKVNFE